MDSNSSPKPARCDIIIPVWNELDRTRRCLKRILCSTSKDYRLILIDNGSKPETRRMLLDFQKEYADQTLLIRNEQNLGFIQGTNQGLKASTAAYVCLLNNDTVVTEGWLDELIRVAESDPTIGLVNANSNTFGQRPASTDIEAIEACGKSLAPQQGEIKELSTAVGFCLLIKRAVLKTVGFLDEAYGMGNFEDADFSQRARQAGFRPVLALGSYVYHEEKVSFKRRPKWEEAFRKNQELYQQRWGKPLRILWEGHDDADSERWLPTLTRWATQGHWVLCSGNFSPETRKLLQRYATIRLMQNNSDWKACLWYLLIRRKKPVDVVVAHDPQFKRWCSWLKLLKFGHRPELLYRLSPNEADQRCQKLSRSL